MHERSFTARPTRGVRYDRAGRTGVVRVFYGSTLRSEDSGFPSLMGWKRGPATGVGFPTIKCTVTCDQAGYWSNLGWIQWVTMDYHGGHKDAALVDRPPSMAQLDLPFATFGYCPTFFDAPAYPSHPRINWNASLFLCTFPMMTRREPIVPLTGFEWGYRIPHRGGAVTRLPLRVAKDEDWKRTRTEVARRHRTWTFAPSFV